MSRQEAHSEWRETLMLDPVADALRRHPGVHDWLARHTRRTSAQSYLVADRLESERMVSSETVALEVMNDHRASTGEARRGSASIAVLPSDLDRLGRRLDEAVFMASLAGNPPYGLPAPAPLPAVASSDDVILTDPMGVAGQVTRELQSALAGERGVRLSSAEVFVESTHTEFRNSRGIAAAMSGAEVFLDFVILAKDGAGDAEMESSVAVHRRHVRDMRVAELARRHAQYARDALVAKLPTTGTWPVLVTDDALVDVVAGAMIGYQLPSLLFRTSAKAKYQRLSPLEVGQSLFGETPATGDAFNVYSNSLLPYGLRTWAFDAEGLPGHRLQIVENGQLARWVGGQRHADYLNVPATGEFGNLEIDPGSISLAELGRPTAQGRLIQVVVWSFMRPDIVTGDFVCEIRLGYEITREGKRPIKGGSVSGNLFAALAGAHFSRETALMGHYQGPVGIRFPGLTVSGK